MDSKSVIFPIAKDVAHDSHMHFYDFVESFHGLHKAPEYDVQAQSINDKLREQYLNDNNWDQKLCFRNCFKMNNRSYVDFCLEQKCEGVAFSHAAQVMGYVKN